MKAFPQIMLLVALGCSSHAQTRPEIHDWTATVRVVDETGHPVPAAETWVSYSIPKSDDQSRDWGEVSGKTDTNGVFVATHKDQSVSIGFHSQKAGYYPTSASHFFGFSATDRSVNWYPAATLVLVTVGNPVAMYAKREETKSPKEDEPVGFDLEAGDWVAPFGKGKRADASFKVHRRILNASEYEALVEMTFPNPGDGIAAQTTSGPGVAPWRTAPEGSYESGRAWKYTGDARPGGVQGYFFRVRTVLDANGTVLSAHYGKIKGDIRFYVGTKAPRSGLGFDYYLNPTPNSRNLEFDPTKNLFKNLGPGEQIQEP